MTQLTVGIADYKIGKSPDVLRALGLGSCVAIALYDRGAKIGGLAHILLPTSTGYDGHNRKKFADSAIVDLVNELVVQGARRENLVAKLTGGAHMFESRATDTIRVGEHNVRSCQDALASLKIPVIANDTGGHWGRAVELNTDSGMLKVITVGTGEKTI
ncbi:MAG: chemotaxis protein CheD [Oscillospiraceae bacterium]|jgi:chemotaxis protein CheD|nr:chemotaxis protein CheD [Oscillospiraceae bacterium]